MKGLSLIFLLLAHTVVVAYTPGIAPTPLSEPDSLDRQMLQKSMSCPGTRNEKGTGLGLILSKDFLEINNGHLQVDSIVGKGSTFTIYIPAQPPGNEQDINK